MNGRDSRVWVRDGCEKFKGRQGGACGEESSSSSTVSVACCSLWVEDAISYLAWTENGQDVLAHVGPEVGMAEVILWLDTWDSLP
jgi:hypothetical protein